MATTNRPSQRPGKLSSKFGAAFAAFENNSGESNVPHAFRSATLRKKTTKPSGGSSTSNPNESNEETPNGAEPIQSIPNSTPAPVKRNFRVSSKLANRAKIFESSNSCDKDLSPNRNTTYQNARHGLRKVKEPSVQGPAVTKSSSKSVSDTESSNINGQDEIVAESTDASEDDNGSECYIEYVIKDTSAHSSIECIYSDDEYEEVWEEETLDSTEDEDDSSWQSWEEETIEDGVFEEEEQLVDANSP